MDRETKHTLDRISSKIPSRLANNLNRVVYDTDQEDRARAALKDPNISREKKNRLAKLLAAGAFRRKQEVPNEEAIAELDRFHEQEIKRARASGKLKDPMTDPFYAKRVKRQQRIAMGLETPMKQKGYSQAEIEKAKQHLDPTINPEKYAKNK